jgi:hypothetical protein
MKYPEISNKYLMLQIDKGRYSDGILAGRPGFDSRHCKIFLFSIAPRPTLGPSQSPSQSIPGALPPGGKEAGA